MPYQVELSPEARKEVLDLPGHVRAQARQLLRALGQTPRPARAKELRGKPNVYRIWLAGRWRVAYEVDDEVKAVRVLRVRRKEAIDYNSLP